MASTRFMVIALLFVGGFAFERVMRGGRGKSIGNPDYLAQSIISSNKHRAWNFPSVCPPSPGYEILQWQRRKQDEYKAKIRRQPLTYLSYVCGFVQIAKNSSTEQNESHGNSVMVMKSVPLCCPGYTRNEENVCVPKCKGGCIHGVCLSPGNCVCYQGYTENKLGQCVQTCPCGCPHGQCHGDTCICEAGYSLDTDTQTCAPMCQPACINGDCTAPDNCSCHLGYTKSIRNNICVPNCHGCYKECERSEDGKCAPVCEGCEHGDCIRTGECTCHQGYVRENNTCVPVCNRRCINGFCAAPDKCECKRGYVKEGRYRCSYGCDPDCYNGVCVGLNQCECHEGFYKRDPVGSPNICYTIEIKILEAISRNVNNLNNGITIYAS